MDYRPPGPSIHRILQARILEWVAIPFSRGSFKPTSLALADGFFTPEPSGKPLHTCMAVLVAQSCLFVTPWTVASVHGILQARTMEWVAIPISRGSS